MEKKVIYFAAIIFGLIALLHALRLFYKFPVAVGNYPVPMWFSYPGFFFAAILAILLWVAAKRR